MLTKQNNSPPADFAPTSSSSCSPGSSTSDTLLSSNSPPSSTTGNLTPNNSPPPTSPTPTVALHPSIPSSALKKSKKQVHWAPDVQEPDAKHVRFEGDGPRGRLHRIPGRPSLAAEGLALAERKSRPSIPRPPPLPSSVTVLARRRVLVWKPILKRVGQPRRPTDDDESMQEVLRFLGRVTPPGRFHVDELTAANGGAFMVDYKDEGQAREAAELINDENLGWRTMFKAQHLEDLIKTVVPTEEERNL